MDLMRPNDAASLASFRNKWKGVAKGLGLGFQSPSKLRRGSASDTFDKFANSVGVRSGRGFEVFGNIEHAQFAVCLARSAAARASCAAFSASGSGSTDGSLSGASSSASTTSPNKSNALA